MATKKREKWKKCRETFAFMDFVLGILELIIAFF